MIPTNSFNNYGYQAPVTPGYQNYIQPQQSPVPMAQMPQPQRTYLNGKYIQSETDILPSEVPMDGNRSYFPSTDEKTIIVKFWDSNGKINTRTYILEETAQSIEQPDILERLYERFDKIEKMLSNNGKTRFNPTNKKEGEQHGN